VATPPAVPIDDVGKLRYRPQGNDAKVQASVIEIAKNSNRSILDPEVIQQAYALHGMAPPATPAPAAAPAPAPAAPVPTPATPAPAPTAAAPDLTAIDAELATHEAAFLEAAGNFDAKAQLEATKAMQDARERRNAILQQQQQAAQAAQAAAQQAVAQEWQTHTVEAISRFVPPNGDSATLDAKARELQVAAQLRGDPITQSIYSGKFFIEEAARALGLPPLTAAPATPPSVATPAPPSVRPPLSSLIAGGTSQQTTRPTTDSPTPRLSKTDYDAMMTNARGIRYGGVPVRASA
jgi:hypothetical protein